MASAQTIVATYEFDAADVETVTGPPTAASNPTSQSLGIASVLAAGPGMVDDTSNRPGTTWDFGTNGNANFFSEAIRSSDQALALSDGDYIGFTFTPTSTVNFSDFIFDITDQGINAGTNYDLFTSVGGFTAGNEIGTFSTPDGDEPYVDNTISIASLTNISTAIEFRLYFHSPGTFDNGTYSIDNVELSASVVPEPSAFALLAGCLAFGWIMVRRRA
jgi:hypothetical protein